MAGLGTLPASAGATRTPSLLDGAFPIQAVFSPSVSVLHKQSSLEMSSQKCPEVSFTTIPGVSQSNQVDNQD
jgi:hypothetical protein